MASILGRGQEVFARAYAFLCGGDAYPTGVTAVTNGQRGRQFLALIILAAPFFGIAWVIEPYVTKYTRIFFTAYIFAVLFFIASVDRYAVAQKKSALQSKP